MRFRVKEDKNAISNVIVVVLSLIIVVIIYSNLILWNYQMNQFDWKRMNEKVKIIDVGNDTGIYYPSSYEMYGSTVLISGNISDLTSNDESYMIFRSYPSITTTSTKNLTAHSENVTIGGSLYYLLKDLTADGSGITLTVDSASTGRKLWGKFVYSLNGVNEISASNWTFYYRVMRSNAAIDAYADVDVEILESNGTVRETIATNVANSSFFSASANTWETISATFSWNTYTVVNQSDYLEVDFYCVVTGAVANSRCSLLIDDGTLSVTDQTRIGNVTFSSISEYISEVEFVGSSDIYDWVQLVWIVDSAWTTGSVNVTLQLYNYTLGGYPQSGNGFINYVSSIEANVNEIKNQTITVSPADFRNATGYWKIKIKGTKATSSAFDLKVDLVELKVTRGIRVELKNEGSETLHLVSLWIINSTYHKHYNVNVLISPQETLNYSRADIKMPENSFILKVITELGNVATFRKH